jgi:hypothetical protein
MAWLCGTVLLLTCLAFNRKVLNFGFLYLRDDDVNVTLNPHMGGIDLARLKWMFTDWSYARRYIPLGWLNFSATYEFAGLDPAPYHAVALGLYLLNTGLVFALVLHALRLFSARERAGGLIAWDAGAAALAAGWWALHPFRVETTAWISGNLYGQATALLLASLLAYLRTYMAAGWRRAALLCLASAGYSASLLTYPLALGIPFLLVGLDWLYARAHAGTPLRRLLVEKTFFFVPLSAALTITLSARFVNTDVFGPVPGMREFPFTSRIAQSSYIAAYYIWKPWWPVHLSPLYETLMDFRPADPPFVLSMAAVTAACAFALLSLRRRPAFAAVWFGYLAVAAPFFGLTEKPHMASDRYGCFLTVIIAAVLAAGLARISTLRVRAGASAVSLVIIGVLGYLSWRQLDVWSDDRKQYAYMVGGIKNAALLDTFGSRQWILEFLRGDEKAASDAVAAKLRANPNSPGYLKAAVIISEKRRIGVYYGPVPYLAVMQERLGLYFARAGEAREANDHFEDALRQDCRFYQAAYDRSLLLLQLGRCDDALQNFIFSERWAPFGLTAAQRQAFLGLLVQASEAEGRPVLARAARTAMAR